MINEHRREQIGFLLTRIVVPLWILGGALFKLAEKTPKLLPKNIWTQADAWGINLYDLLTLLIALEFLAIGVMVLVPRFAKLMAIFMLGAFCVILIAEILAGNTACGCLGAFSPPPWVMLLIDGSLLAGVLWGRQRAERVGDLSFVLLLGWIILGFVITGARILPEARPVPQLAAGGDPSDPQVQSRPPVPSYYTPQADDWIGKPFRDIDLAGWVDGWPEDLDSGLRYVIFFSRSCDHCQALLETHFAADPAIPTTVVAIPESKDGFNLDAALPMNYCSDCVGQLELPVGCDWIITPPMMFALEDGKVTCVQEADDAMQPACLLWG